MLQKSPTFVLFFLIFKKKFFLIWICYNDIFKSFIRLFTVAIFTSSACLFFIS